MEKQSNSERAKERNGETGRPETGKKDDAFGTRAKADGAKADSRGNVCKDDDEREAAEPLAN